MKKIWLGGTVIALVLMFASVASAANCNGPGNDSCNNNNGDTYNKGGKGGAGGEGGEGGSGGVGIGIGKGGAGGQGGVGIGKGGTGIGTGIGTGVGKASSGAAAASSVNIGGDVYKAADLSRGVPDFHVPDGNVNNCMIYIGLGGSISGGGGGAGIPVGEYQKCVIEKQISLLIKISRHIPNPFTKAKLMVAAGLLACKMDNVADVFEKVGLKCDLPVAGEAAKGSAASKVSFETSADDLD